MNGGAWLRCGSEKVDVLLRDLDVVEHWTSRAENGAGGTPCSGIWRIPTSPQRGTRSCRPLRGDIPAAVSRSSSRPRRRCGVSAGHLASLRAHACPAWQPRGGDGQRPRRSWRAHAILRERGQWVYAKRLIEIAGLVGLHALFECRQRVCGLVNGSISSPITRRAEERRPGNNTDMASKRSRISSFGAAGDHNSGLTS
jgi:hypothetical protein